MISMYHRCLSVAALSLLVSIASVSVCHSQDAGTEPTLDDQLIVAIRSPDTDVAADLIRRNRLEIKPIVESLIGDAISLELDGESDKAARTLETARLISRLFEKTFGETSLELASSYPAEWNSEQKRAKLHADSLYRSGTLLRRDRETMDQAGADYEAALDLYRQVGDRLGEASALGGLGYVAWYIDKDQYLGFNEQALKIRIEVDDRQLVGNSLNDVGLAYSAILRDNEKALEYWLRSERIRLAIGDSLALSRLLPSIGRTYSLLGDLQTAIEYYDRAAAIAAALGDFSREAVALRNAGANLSDLSRLSEALDYFERALAARNRAGDPPTDVLIHLGITHRRLGDFESALRYYQQVVGLATESGDGDELAHALSNIGVVYLYAERPDRSIRYFERALDQFQSIENPDGVLSATINLGSASFEMQDYASARDFADSAVGLARELEDEQGEIVAQILMGNVLTRQNEFEDAIRSYRMALSQATALKTPNHIFSAKLGLGEAFERQQSFEKAISSYEEAFEILESTRGRLNTDEDKAGFLAQQRYSYEEYIHMLSKLHGGKPNSGYEERAFQFAERAKARSFLDLLAEALGDVQSGVDPSVLQKEDSLLQQVTYLRNDLSLENALPQKDTDRIAALSDSLARSESAYANLQRQIRDENPRYAALQYPEPSTLAEIQSSVVDQDVALLEYSVGDSSSTLWVITADDVQLAALPGRETIRQHVELLRHALSDPNNTDADRFSATARRLYELLVVPAIPLIGSRTHLVIVPDDVLFYVPFEALVTDSGAEGSGFESLPYLVDRYAISYSQSSSILRQLVSGRSARGHADTKGLLAFGDPVFEKESAGNASEFRSEVGSLDRLPFSGQEVTAIADHFGKGDADVFLRADATEDNLKLAEAAGHYKYLHLATHGLIDERRPDFSAVVLAHDDDDSEDGLLQAAEIFNLKLSADLVVLSACETGLGKMVRGEGLVGLTRAFMYAGAPSVVVSLWRVADESTATLMESLYSNLVDGSGDKSQALQGAKLRMIESGSLAHPFYWAPFVLSGDWK